MHTKSKTRPKPLRLIAELAITGIHQTPLSPEEGAEFYEGLSSLLDPPGAEAARYAATCLRECDRAHREIVAALRAEGRDGTL